MLFLCWRWNRSEMLVCRTGGFGGLWRSWPPHLEHGEFLPLLFDGEGGVWVEDDRGAGGLRVQLPFLRDPRSLGACVGGAGSGGGGAHDGGETGAQICFKWCRQWRFFLSPSALVSVRRVVGTYAEVSGQLSRSFCPEAQTVRSVSFIPTAAS